MSNGYQARMHLHTARGAEGFIQDPAARRLAERLGEGNPYRGDVLSELFMLRRYGVEWTPEIVDKAVDTVIARSGPRPPREYVELPPAAPKSYRATERFGRIPTSGEVVYYMRIGNRVKIGTSGNLARRLNAINPEELMALEVGGVRMERHRHAQFKELRTHGEWFRLEDPLIGHIEKVKKEWRT